MDFPALSPGHCGQPSASAASMLMKMLNQSIAPNAIPRFVGMQAINEVACELPPCPINKSRVQIEHAEPRDVALITREVCDLTVDRFDDAPIAFHGSLH
jgi:hypothetical protein